ncbi:MAG TPA: glycoside hydrolase family 140 protein [Prolixibacteraceae bacterium]|nr:glycoside hydrolase family 140 protein [Prolixibacteraceae bacterium]
MKKIIALLIVCLPFISAGQKLHVSENNRYLETEEDKPFVWIGDTAWELFHKLNREDARLYLKDRAAKGFTIIQAVVLAEMDGLKTPNAYGEVPLIDMNPEKPNEKYFSHVDFIVDEAQKLGLYIGMLPTWGDKVTPAHGGGPVIFTEDNAGTYGRFLGERYKYKPIVWILGGDREVADEKELKVWRAMAQGLRTGSKGNHLISYHPRGASSSHKKLHNEEWLDFNMYQSGHEKHFNEVYRYAETLNSVEPLKPYVDAEAAYEDIAVKFWDYCDWSTPLKVPAEVLNSDKTINKKEHFTKGFINAHDVRVAAYWNFLSGACGYTYGNNAIWQMFEKWGNLNIPCLTDWREALNRPGAGQMKYVHQLFKEYPLSKLNPDQSIVSGVNPTDSLHVRAAMATDRSFALVYLSLGQPVSVDLAKLGKEVSASWYNPRDGKMKKTGSYKNTAIQQFTPPTNGADNDWLLVLKSK